MSMAPQLCTEQRAGGQSSSNASGGIARVAPPNGRAATLVLPLAYEFEGQVVCHELWHAAKTLHLLQRVLPLAARLPDLCCRSTGVAGLVPLGDRPRSGSRCCSPEQFMH